MIRRCERLAQRPGAIGLSCALALALAFPSPGARAGGDDSAESVARDRFSDGNRRYALGDYSGAKEAFEAAIALDAKLPGPYRNLGLVLLATHRCDAAVEAFRAYLRLRPTGVHTARIEQEIARCTSGASLRALPSETSRATVQVTSEGVALAGALVRVDGAARGSAPLQLDLAPGRHAILVEKAGFAPGEATVFALAGGRQSLIIPLRAPIPSPVAPMRSRASGRRADSEIHPCAKAADCAPGERCIARRCALGRSGGESRDGGTKD